MYLASGWYRMGQGIYTCSVLWGELGPTPVIWTRLPLRDFTFDKRQRKLMRRNFRRFEVKIRRFVFHEEQEDLFAVYRASFDGFLADSFKSQVNGTADGNVFDSMEVAIFDGPDLVAFSLFDQGMSSVTSISGIYHPDYARYSLGYWTMLLEMAYAQEQKKQHYYPGYVVPGIPKFDYKLRIGKNIEGFLPEENRWIPYRRFPHELLEPNVVIKLLSLLAAELRSLGLQARLFPKFGYTFEGRRGLLLDSREFMALHFDSPWLLVVALPQPAVAGGQKQLVVVSYNPVGSCFCMKKAYCHPAFSNIDAWPPKKHIRLSTHPGGKEMGNELAEPLSCTSPEEVMNYILRQANES